MEMILHVLVYLHVLQIHVIMPINLQKDVIEIVYIHILASMI